MNRRALITSVAAAIAVCTVPLVGTVTPVKALATNTVALYEMSEAAGNNVLIDSSGNNVNGASGPNVIKGVVFQGATVHRYSGTASDGSVRSPTKLPVEPERLDTVAHSTSQNPDSQDFAITVRYRTNKSFGNLIQKGQNGTVGGYFKIELPAGRPTCLFKGTANGRVVQRAVVAPTTVDLSDNVFHTIRCERLQNRVTLFIDGVEVKRITGSSGNIANTRNLSIAGKSNCDQVETTCDYFVGDIDWVRIEKGSGVTNPPPVASFTSSCTFLSCTFNAAASSDPNGSIASYAWNFGDNTTGSGVAPAHTYGTPGTRTVTLTVTDNAGATTSTTRTVTTVADTPPTARFTSSCADDACTFDATTSSDANGPISSFAWDFGDINTDTDTSTDNPASYLFPGPGTYDVALTVTDNTGLTGTVTHPITILENQPPVAAFTSSCVGLACTFDASTSSDPNGPIASYAWDFGGGVTATGISAAHTFGEAGTFPVALTVTDSPGLGNTTTADVTVSEVVAPTISFVGQASASGQLTTHAATVPASVQAGDGLLLFFSSGTAATVGQPAGVTGWTQIDSVGGGAITGSTTVWRKVATAGDAGAQVRITLSTQSKGNIMIAAYRGTSTTNPVADFTRQLLTNSSATRTTPIAPVATATWALSYWMHRDSSTAALTPPAGVTTRAAGGLPSGGGRVATLLADSDGSVPVGTYGGLSATAAASSTMGTSWTIILAPA